MFIYKRTPRRTRLGDLCPSPTATSPPPLLSLATLPPSPHRAAAALRSRCPSPFHPLCLLAASCLLPTSVALLHGGTQLLCRDFTLRPPESKKVLLLGTRGGSASCRTHAAESPLRAAAAVGFCLNLHVSETKFIGRAGWCGSNNVQWYFSQMLKYLFLTNLK